MQILFLFLSSSLFQNKRIFLNPDSSITSALLKTPRLTLAGLPQRGTSDLKRLGTLEYLLSPATTLSPRLRICFSISWQSRSFIPPPTSDRPSMALCLLKFPYQSLIDKGKLLGPPSTNLALDPSPCTIHGGF